MGINDIETINNIFNLIYGQPVNVYIDEEMNRVIYKFLVVPKNKVRPIYREDSDGYWKEWEFDKNGSLIYSEDSTDKK